MTPEAFEREQCQDFPLRKVPTADQCAGTVIYLASDLSAPVTGQSVAVNAGRWFVA